MLCYIIEEKRASISDDTVKVKAGGLFISLKHRYYLFISQLASTEAETGYSCSR